MPTITGVDVASYQAGWRPAPSDKFVFVKTSQATTYANPQREAQVAAARAAGLQVGHYHFLHPGDARRQAQLFAAKIPDLKAGELLCCDWENTDEGHPSVADAADFIAEVKRLRPGHKVLLYCNESDWLNTAVKAPDGLWLARYGGDPDPSIRWDFWQWTDQKDRPNAVDQNRSRFSSLAKLKAWAAGRRTVADGVITHFADLPIKTAYRSTALWQGAAYAKNPVTGAEYVFQLQAQELDEGDVETTWVHRYRLKGNTLTYLDSMKCSRFGHCQTLHVRISKLGNTRVWLGVEEYDEKHRKTGTKVWRLLYTPGTVTRSGKHQRIYTGSGSSAPISSPDGYLWIRRPGDVEVFERHTEKALLAWRHTIDRPKPDLIIRAPKDATIYQSSCATKDTVYRVNGATDDPSLLSEFTVDGLVGQLDVTAATSPAAGKVTSEELEAVLLLRGRVAIEKRFNKAGVRRVVALFSVGPADE